MAILQDSDFSSGEYAIPQSKFTKLSAYIAKYEKTYLIDLLGVEFYDLFIADLTPTTPQVPQDADYLFIFNPFAVQINDCNIESRGIKEMLKALVFFHFMREDVIRKTTFGATKQKAEVADNVGYDFNLIDAYNNAFEIAGAIQHYIEYNNGTYPAYNGDYFESSSGI